ncbi:MAG: hypothetical protein ACJAWV_001338 [Flammeovirgaceae bacterium]
MASEYQSLKYSGEKRLAMIAEKVNESEENKKYKTQV